MLMTPSTPARPRLHLVALFKSVPTHPPKSIIREASIIIQVGGFTRGRNCLLITPRAYVLPLQYIAGPNRPKSYTTDYITHHVSTIRKVVCFQNSKTTFLACSHIALPRLIRNYKLGAPKEKRENGGNDF